MQYAPPPDEGLSLIYSDKYLVIVNKPAELLSVPGRGEEKQDCQYSRVRREFSNALIVHRLDMSTSGLLMFARKIEMQRRLSALFSDRQISKRYIAIVGGRLDPAEGSVDLPIVLDWEIRPRRIISAELGKPSLTHYRTLTAGDETTRVELEPYTGRTHQLRVHMKAIGHPIVGDTLYDGLEAPRLMLHAAELGFNHPVTGETLQFSCPPPF